VTAYGVLSRGLLSGHWTPDRELLPGDFRRYGPRFQDGNVAHNLALVDALRKIAESKGVTVAQLAVAWVAAQGQDIVPLVGARTRTRLTESLGAAEVELSTTDLAEIDAAVPAGSAAGARYARIDELDSER
jgi:aryl-alcohol dehydrogenase-like predicted oxidoreductase